ncbi:MFS transporter [Streptacidiphilus anmyonensis]|uniref:MFS transporter n=1 Tax=Streptacidiphilus anmyonensis TaxID=405782 RepID=UPI0005A74ECB|nr:MFS transporter [Streptacidiphilus anmyonensis]
MTETVASSPASVTPRPPLVTRPLLLRFVSLLGGSTSFYLLLAAVPGFAAAHGGGGGSAGLATAALMLSTVAGELATPALVGRLGYRVVLATGLALLGAPALALTASGALWAVATVCALRGIGFAFTVVAGGALTASLVPAERRGEGLALVGIVSGVPALVALPLGVWLAAHAGYGVVFTAGAVSALAAIVAVPGLPDRVRAAGRGVSVAEGLRTGELLRPALVFAATTLAVGIVVTFLPLTVPRSQSGTVTAALLVQPAAATVARWVAGRRGDRRGPAGLVIPGLLLAALGTLLLALAGGPVAVVAAMALFGTGFGLAQNSTLTLMYCRVPEAAYGTVSALWNFAYDAGMGVGALAFGWVATATGYRWAFALTALAMLTALAPALTDRRSTPTPQTKETPK